MSVAIHVHTPPRKLVTQERAIASVPAGVATFRCPPHGIRLNDIPLEHRQCQLYLVEGAKAWIAKMLPRGYEYADFYDVHAFGPFPSYNLGETMKDVTDYNVDPRTAASMVGERSTEIEQFADYRLVANFTARPTEFDNPVVIDTSKPGAR